MNKKEYVPPRWRKVEKAERIDFSFGLKEQEYKYGRRRAVCKQCAGCHGCR